MNELVTPTQIYISHFNIILVCLQLAHFWPFYSLPTCQPSLNILTPPGSWIGNSLIAEIDSTSTKLEKQSIFVFHRWFISIFEMHDPWLWGYSKGKITLSNSAGVIQQVGMTLEKSEILWRGCAWNWPPPKFKPET